jgi:hypothetical protein
MAQTTLTRSLFTDPASILWYAGNESWWRSIKSGDTCKSYNAQQYGKQLEDAQALSRGHARNYRRFSP